MTTNTSHRDCTHPTTPAGRAACRKARAAATLVANASVDSCLDALAGVNMPTPGCDDFKPARKIVKVEWDRETCGRCGGSGAYPSAAWDGICLGCNGKGRKLTRKGRAAFNKYNNALRAGNTVMAHELNSGDLIVNRDGKRIKVYAVDYAVESSGSTTIGTEGHENYMHYKTYAMKYTTSSTTYYVDPRDEILVWPSDDKMQELFRLVEKMSGAHITYES